VPGKKGCCLTLPKLEVNDLLRVLGGTRFQTFVLMFMDPCIITQIL